MGYPDIQWVILGDGRRMEWVKEQVALRGLSASFHLMGRYAPEQGKMYCEANFEREKLMDQLEGWMRELAV